jgi:hypothetical protein
MFLRAWAFAAQLILLACAVQSFDGWLPFVFSTADAAPRMTCDSLFQDPSELRLFDQKEFKEILALAKATKNLTAKKQEPVFKALQTRLLEFGFENQITKDSDGTKVIELTSFPTDILTGRIMRAAQKRFQIRFFIDPYVGVKDSYMGVYLPEINAISLSPFEFSSQLHRLNQVLLHEIRHGFFTAKLNKGVDDKFQIDIMADDGKRLMESGFVDEFLSSEELSNHFKDTKVTLRQYRVGRAKLREVKKELNYLGQYCDASIEYLNQILGQDLVKDRRIWKAPRWVVNYKVVRQMPSGKVVPVGIAIVDVFGLPETATTEELNQAAQTKARALLAIAKKYRAFVDAEQQKLELAKSGEGSNSELN